MHIPSSRLPRPRRFAWLLWFGLVLPLAQFAGMAHALSHASQEAAREGETKQAPGHAHCDLCLAAAAMGGAAPAGPVATLDHPAIGHELAPVFTAGVLSTLPLRSYQGRAPPDAAR